MVTHANTAKWVRWGVSAHFRRRPILALFLAAALIELSQAATIVVGFPSTEYVVGASNQSFVVSVTLDGDDNLPGFQGVGDGLYSYALKLKYPPDKASSGVSAISLAPVLDNDGFDTGPARREAGVGYVSVEGIIGFTNRLYGPLTTGLADPAGTWPVLATVVLTNLAGPSESYLIELGSTGLGEWTYATQNGDEFATFDDQIRFGAARVTVNTAPFIATIPDQALRLGAGPATLKFSVGDNQTPTGDLAVTVDSSNPFVIPVENLQVDGTGTERTLTATPLPDARGATLVTLRVSDGQLVAESNVMIYVGQVAPPAPRFANVHANRDNVVQMEINAQIGSILQLEMSDDWTTWKAITNATVGALPVVWKDTLLPQSQHRFYRLVTPNL